MAKNPEERRDRYDVSGNVEAQYVDAAETVLRNKLGITDLTALQTVEEQAFRGHIGFYSRRCGPILG